jgi:hypothetical protein
MDFATLAHVHSLPTEHRFVSALLKADKDEAGKLLRQERKENSVWIDLFCHETEVGHLPVLIYQRICELGLAPAFSQLHTADGLLLLDRLRLRSTQALFDYSIMDNQFVQILDLLGDLTGNMIWLKGTALSRTLYDRPEQRFSVDFDVVVNRRSELQIFQCLQELGYSPMWKDGGFCHQYGVGPMNSFTDMFLVPSGECGGCHNLTFAKQGCPQIELKFNGLETGLTMVEADRFFGQARKIHWSGRQFFGPDYADHLMIELVHFHKHQFGGWGWLFDIHLLANKLSEEDGAWLEFVRRCLTEGITASAWKGLTMSRALLSSNIPDKVIEELKPHYSKLWQGLFLRTSSEFIWNCNSLPMLLMNTVLVGGRRRKLKILAQLLRPSDLFLSSYYANGRTVGFINRWFYLILHWLVLALPGGLIRRSLGRLLWRPQPDASLIAPTK